MSQAPSGAFVAASFVTDMRARRGRARSARRAAGCAAHCRGRPLEEQLPPSTPGLGPELDDLVGGAHGLLVVLDDEDGVAPVAQAAQLAEQPLVVLRMQADARLVQDVDDADQAHPELGGEAHPLRLPAGKRRVVAVEVR